MKHFEELLQLVKSYEKNFHDFYVRGNKTAGIRLRKDMQELRDKAKYIRDDVQAVKSDMPKGR